MSFGQAIEFTLSEEGDYVDNPNDSGRATNCGVTQAAYDTWRDIQRQPRRAVLLMTEAEKLALYQGNYWIPAKCDRMPAALGIAHFDWTVNHGVSGANKTLQQTLGFDGAAVDGVAGAQTFIALAAIQDVAGFVKRYNERRRQWYRDRVVAKPDQAEFLKGWLGRVDRLDQFVEKL